MSSRQTFSYNLPGTSGHENKRHGALSSSLTSCAPSTPSWTPWSAPSHPPIPKRPSPPGTKCSYSGLARCAGSKTTSSTCWAPEIVPIFAHQGNFSSAHGNGERSCRVRHEMATTIILHRLHARAASTMAMPPRSSHNVLTTSKNCGKMR